MRPFFARLDLAADEVLGAIYPIDVDMGKEI